MQVESYEAARQREDVRTIVADVMDINDVQHVPPAERGIIKATGRLLHEPQAAYAHIAPRLHALGYTPLLQDEAADLAAVVAMPGVVMPSRSRLWLALLLFVITVFSTIFVGSDGLNLVASALVLGERLSLADFNWGLGLAFSGSLLSILLAHELGHFLAARRMGVAVSYPFFIPMPFTLIGTMGAFIAMKEPPPNRRALLSIAVAGPLAGLVVAIPVLLFGLSISEVRTFESMEAEARAAIAQTEGVESVQLLMEGNSLLYAGAKILVFGRFLPSGGEDVSLHQVAWAGWVGLLVTALNLIPAGQLDGGHIFYALAGPRLARRITWVMVAILIVLGFYWVGWFLWAVLISLFGQYRAPLLNELTPLDTRERWLAVLGLVVFVLVFMPVPLSFITFGGS
jgi:membrane-associated protease RseP (regulator of RpoE activity)